jgi:hypothetical protein
VLSSNARNVILLNQLFQDAAKNKMELRVRLNGKNFVGQIIRPNTVDVADVRSLLGPVLGQWGDGVHLASYCIAWALSWKPDGGYSAKRWSLLGFLLKLLVCFQVRLGPGQ